MKINWLNCNWILFGPIDVDPNSETYGFVASTPKPHWSNVDLLGLIAKEFNIPFYFTTDVNSSAYGETLVHVKVLRVLFTTLSELVLEPVLFKMREFIGGMGHTEAGHVYVNLFTQMMFPMNLTELCSFHRGCLEGLAAGPSLELSVQVFVAN